MMKINLLPRRRNKKREQAIQWAGVFAAALVVSLIGNYLWVSAFDSAEAQIAERMGQYDSKLAEANRLISEIKNIEKEADDVKQKLTKLAELRQGRVGPPALMDGLSTLIPEKVTINQWSEATTASGGASSSVDISGYAQSFEELSSFLMKLRSSPYFSNPTLKSSQNNTTDTSVTFTVTCGFKYTES